MKNTYSSTANAPTTLHLNTSDDTYSINATYTGGGGGSSGGTLGPTVPGALLDPGATGYIVLSGRYQVSGPITLTQLSGYTSGGSQVSHLPRGRLRRQQR